MSRICVEDGRCYAASALSEFVGQGVAPHPNTDSSVRQFEPRPGRPAVTKVMESRERGGTRFAVPELFAVWPRILDFEAPAII